MFDTHHGPPTGALGGDDTMSALPRCHAVTLSLLTSLLYVLAFPNFNVSWLAWIALAPLIFVSRLSSLRQTFLWGWLSGTLAYLGILYWIIVTFRAAHLSIALSALCLLLLAAYLGLYWGAWCCLLVIPRGFSQGIHVPPTTAFGGDVITALYGAAAWVALEYLRTYLFSGFPWALLADSQVRHLPLIQIASITGAYGVSFVVMLVNLTIAAYFHRRHPRITLSGNHHAATASDGWPHATAGMTTLIVLSSYLFGLQRLHRPLASPSSRPVRVALLQGNIDQYKKWDKSYVLEIQKTYEALTTQTLTFKPDLIVWPETSVPGYLLQEPSLKTWLRALVRKSKTSHLVGSPAMYNERAYNSAFSITPEGDIDGEYAKQHLVPFGEIVPWSNVLGRFIRVLNELGGFAAGERSPVLAVAAGGRLCRVGVNICYEAIFPNLVRQSVLAGAEIIANLTNDGWYMRTAAPYQHLAPNILRAVENDRWVIRANNTGVTALIDPSGRVRHASPIFQRGLVLGRVEPRQSKTPYTRLGDLFAWLCCVVVAVPLWARRRSISPI
jgi:apolipoprotein N-acyltransferase